MGFRCTLTVGVLLASIAIAACGDPTEDAFPVTIVNDTPNRVTLRQCGANCTTFVHSAEVGAGGGVAVNATSENLDEYFVVDAGGQTLGCLNLRFQQRRNDVRVPVSARGKCP